MATILAVTNSFSDENKIGQGGFGVVYKVRNMFMQNADIFFFAKLSKRDSFHACF